MPGLPRGFVCDASYRGASGGPGIFGMDKMTDTLGMIISVEKASNGVVVRFGNKMRTFSAEKWAELNAAVQEVLK